MGPVACTAKVDLAAGELGVIELDGASVRQVALSAYTAAQVRAWAPEPRTAEWAHGEANDGRLVAITTRDDGTARVLGLATAGCQAALAVDWRSQVRSYRCQR